MAWIAERFDELFADKQGGIPGGYFDLSRPYDAPGQDHLPQALFPEQRFPELRDDAFHRNAQAHRGALLGVSAGRRSTDGAT